MFTAEMEARLREIAREEIARVFPSPADLAASFQPVESAKKEAS